MTTVAKSINVVTISASLGAGGSVVGPAVANRLDLPFVDRALPLAVSRRLHWPLEDLLAHDERPPSLLERLFGGLAGSEAVSGIAEPAGATLTDHDYCAATGQVLRELADTSGGVVLGRAAALVLAGHPRALHVRLDGDRAARVARVAAGLDGNIEAAGRELDRSDRDREGYVRHFYKADARDPRHYHLVIDSTVIPLEICTELIVTTARAGISVRDRARPR
jgi:cytidylate kinase